MASISTKGFTEYANKKDAYNPKSLLGKAAGYLPWMKDDDLQDVDSYMSGEQGWLPDQAVPPMQGGWGLTNSANQVSPTLNNEGFTGYANRKGTKSSTNENAGKPQFKPSASDGSGGYEDYLTTQPEDVTEMDMTAREYARGGEGGFNPSDNASVKRLQKLMGFSEEDQDGILGDQTMTALKKEQGLPAWQGGAATEATYGEGVDEFGDGYSFGEPADPYANVGMPVETKPIPNEGLIHNTKLGGRGGDGSGGPAFKMQGNNERSFSSPIDQSELNQKIRMSRDQNSANANERYYDNFFDSDENELGGYSHNPADMPGERPNVPVDIDDSEFSGPPMPIAIGGPGGEPGFDTFGEWTGPDDEVPYEGDSGMGEQWPAPDKEGELQGPPPPPFNDNNASMGVNPAFDATATEGINRFMPGSPGNFGKGTGGVGVQFNGDVRDLEMGNNPIFSAMKNQNSGETNETSGEKFIDGQPNENGRYKDDNGQVVQLSKLHDPQGRFMGWGNPEGYEESSGTGEAGQYNINSPNNRRVMPWETDQDVGPYNPGLSKEQILEQFRNYSDKANNYL